MEVEIFGVAGFVALSEVDAVGWWCPLGREDEGCIVVAGIGGGLLNLVHGEVLQGSGLDGLVGVAEFGAGELGGCWPCCEDGGSGILQVDEAYGLLVQHDQVAIGEIVLGREGIGRVDPDSREEACCAEGGDGKTALRDFS